MNAWRPSSPEDFLTVFQQIHAAGDEAVCVLISSALSGTLQSAVIAASMEDALPISPTIGTHIGPGAFGVVFVEAASSGD